MRNPIRAIIDRVRSGLSPSQRDRVVEAIGEAERGNRGEVRVHIEAECPTDNPLERARQLFGELGMHQTVAATGVMLYIADVDRTCAVFAADGIFETRDPDFWQHVVDEVGRGYQRHEPVAGIAAALGEIGDVLRERVSGEDTAGNELPDEVSGG